MKRKTRHSDVQINIFKSKLCARTDGINEYAKSPSLHDVVSIDNTELLTDSLRNCHHAFQPESHIHSWRRLSLLAISLDVLKPLMRADRFLSRPFQFIHQQRPHTHRW